MPSTKPERQVSAVLFQFPLSSVNGCLNCMYFGCANFQHHCQMLLPMPAGWDVAGPSAAFLHSLSDWFLWKVHYCIFLTFLYLAYLNVNNALLCACLSVCLSVCHLSLILYHFLFYFVRALFNCWLFWLVLHMLSFMFLHFVTVN